MNKSIYLYDGSFINLLNLIYKLYKNKIIPLDIKDTNYQVNLFDNVINLNIENNDKIINKIIDNLGIAIFNTMYKLYLSNDNNKELLIYYFFGYSLKYKNKIFYLRNNELITKCLKISKYVGNENHKYKGFLRFKELDNNILYGEISPINNVLPLLVNHFKERLSNELWIIKDTKRNTLAIYDRNEVYIVDANDVKIKINNYSNNEKQIQDLWKTFYKTVAIKERKNELCRMNFIPKRYWKYIIEMGDEYEKSN